MLVFNQNTGVQAEDTAITRARIAEDWKDAFYKDGSPTLNVSSSTPAGQLIDAEAALVAEKDAELLYIANQFNPETSIGIWQDALCKWFSIRRKIDTPSWVNCTCRGLSGTVIPRGSIVSTQDNKRFYSDKQAVIGEGGTVSVKFIHEKNGPYEIKAKRINKIITVIPGWDTVINDEDAHIGTSRESDQELESRRKELIAINSRGSVSALYAALYNCLPQGMLEYSDGKMRHAYVKIQDNDTSYPIPWYQYGTEGEDVDIIIPPHTTCIIMLGGEDDDIAKAIYENKSCGSGTYGNHEVHYKSDEFYGIDYKYEIIRPMELSIDFEIIVSGVEIAGYGGLAAGAIASIWNTAWDYVNSADFFCPVQKAGIMDLLDIKIKSPRDLDDWVDIIRVPALYYPVIGKITVISRR